MINYRSSLIRAGVFFLCALLFISCSGSPDDKAQLEVSGLRYESAETSRCVGGVKNISQRPLGGLKVEVEFRTENGSRVRGVVIDLPDGPLAPNTGVNFTAPYVKGPNDSQVSACGVLRVKTQEGGTLLHVERRAD
jgi:hypothetical protein